jgi:hypothetical protein
MDFMLFMVIFHVLLCPDGMAVTGKRPYIICDWTSIEILFDKHPAGIKLDK